MNRTHTSRRTCLAALAGLSALASGASWAQETFPSRPIKIILPFPPGGAGDTAVRLVARQLAEAFGQNVVIDNKPGGDGVIAAQSLLLAPPDGYTLMFGSASPLIYVPLVHAEKPPYDPMRDFAAVSTFSSFTYYMHVHESVPARSIREFMDYVKANPGKVAYGTGDSTSVVTMAQVRLHARLDMTHIPYKGGGPAFIDFAAGRIQVMVGPLDLDARMQGKSRPLVVLQDKRSPLRPEVPTFAEIGLPEVNLMAWTGFFAPGRTPRPILDRLSADMVKAFSRPELVSAFAKLGSNLQGSTPEALASILRTQTPVWREAIQFAKIKPE